MKVMSPASPVQGHRRAVGDKGRSRANRSARAHVLCRDDFGTQSLDRLREATRQPDPAHRDRRVGAVTKCPVSINIRRSRAHSILVKEVRCLALSG